MDATNGKNIIPAVAAITANVFAFYAVAFHPCFGNKYWTGFECVVLCQNVDIMRLTPVSVIQFAAWAHFFKHTETLSLEIIIL